MTTRHSESWFVFVRPSVQYEHMMGGSVIGFLQILRVGSGKARRTTEAVLGGGAASDTRTCQKDIAADGPVF